MRSFKIALFGALAFVTSTSFAYSEKLNMEPADIEIEVQLNVPAAEAWHLWTDSKKLQQWLAPKADVNPKLDGAYELFWDPSNPKDNSTLGCKITAFVPNRLIAFQWRGPVPFADIMNTKPFPTWVTISFEAISTQKAILHFRHSGWGAGAAWQEARIWQENAWLEAFKQLEILTTNQTVEQ
jgi:uncharacterized protein YndB with AHSA1/START domain